MNFDDLIGFPLEFVTQKLKDNSINFTVKNNSEIQKKFDTLLVVNINKISENFVEIITDKFLLDI